MILSKLLSLLVSSWENDYSFLTMSFQDKISSCNDFRTVLIYKAQEPFVVVVVVSSSISVSGFKHRFRNCVLTLSDLGVEFC